MKTKRLMFFYLFFLLLSFHVSFSQVSPEIQLGARGVISFNTDFSPTTSSAVNDFSDTGILLGFRQKLYSKFRAQLVIGFQFPDAESDLGQLFFHQTFIRVESQHHILKMGRSRVKSTLIEFPTLRDDDALFFTDVLNPFSNGENTEDNQYGNVLELSHIFGQRIWLTVHGEHFTQSQPPGVPETDFSLNALGGSIEYRVPITQIWNRPFIQQIGIGLNNFLTDRPGYTNQWDKALKNISFSAIVNLLRDPVYFVDFRFQTIYNIGFQEFQRIFDFFSLSRSKSIATFTSLRYLLRKLERPTLQISASFGFKTFPNVLTKTQQWQAITNAFYRLGDNFDVIIQVQYQKNWGDLIPILGNQETRVQFGFVYSIDQSWNNQFDDRESLLNLEHGYIP